MGMWTGVWTLQIVAMLLLLLIALTANAADDVVDCTEFCSIPVYHHVNQGTIAARVKLPQTFHFYFEYNVQYFFSADRNFMEITCGGKRTFRMDLQFPNLVHPYYLGKELKSNNPDYGSVEVAVQPEERLPTSATKKERYFNVMAIDFLESTVGFSGIEFHQEKEFKHNKGLADWGECEIWASNERSDSYAEGAVIRNIQIYAHTYQPSALPTYKPTPSPFAWITEKPTPAPSTAVPTNHPLCCSSTDYSDTWKECNDAADTTLGYIGSCSKCLSYQCMDWTLGSKGMRERQLSYYDTTGDDVYFAVGSYGRLNTRAGNCYRLDVEGVGKDIIFQVITAGPDHSNTVQLQIANGGLGFDGNSCSSFGTEHPQFEASDDPWGDLAFGWPIKEECTNLPKYPMCGKLQEDNLHELCEWTFDNGFRVPTPATEEQRHPLVNSMCLVTCPYQLWQATGYHRSDEKKNDFSCNALNGVYNIPATYTSRTDLMAVKGGMDCSKPSYGFEHFVPKGVSFYHGHDVVVPCKRDGYARINQRPTSQPTSLPTEVPTSRPSSIPTSKPTSRPSLSYRPTITPTFIPTTNASLAESGGSGDGGDNDGGGSGGSGGGKRPVDPNKEEISLGNGQSIGQLWGMLFLVALVVCAVFAVWGCWNETALRRKEKAAKEVRMEHRRRLYQSREEADERDDFAHSSYDSEEDDGDEGGTEEADSESIYDNDNDTHSQSTYSDDGRSLGNMSGVSGSNSRYRENLSPNNSSYNSSSYNNRSFNSSYSGV